MQRSGRFLVLVGIVLGIMAAVAIVLTLNSSTQRVTVVPPKLVKVVVAEQNVPQGIAIVQGAVTTQDWPEEAIRLDIITNTAEVVGKISTTRIVPGQVFVHAMVVDKA